MNLNSYKIKNLPDNVEQAWWYSGKINSIHVVFKDKEIPQLNIEFRRPKKRKKTTL